MLLLGLILMPMLGIFFIFTYNTYDLKVYTKNLKIIALSVTIINLVISLIIWLLFDNSSKQFQFVQEHYNNKLLWFLFRYRWFIYIFYIINNYNNAYCIYYLIENQ